MPKPTSRQLARSKSSQRKSKPERKPRASGRSTSVRQRKSNESKRSTWNNHPERRSTSSAKREIEIIVRGVLMVGSKILLCHHPKKNYFYLPGGHVDFAEPAAVALQREFVEECGLDVRVGPLLMLTEHSFRTKKRQHHEINLVFYVEPPHPTDPIRDAGQLLSVRSLEPEIEMHWVDLASVVDLAVYPASTKAMLASGLRGVYATEDRGAVWISEMNSK